MEQTRILHEMNEKLSRVEAALSGDPKFGSKGLVSRVSALENWKWVAMSLGGVGIIIGSLLKFNVI